MPLTSKSTRELESLAKNAPDEFDFGEPEIVTVEIHPGKFLSLKEPNADELMEIEKISEDESQDEIEATLKIICILHSPNEGGRKLTLKDAKRLRGKQIKKIGEAMSPLLKGEDEASDMKSND
jgi:hypothetical protein